MINYQKYFVGLGSITKAYPKTAKGYTTVKIPGEIKTCKIIAK